MNNKPKSDKTHHSQSNYTSEYIEAVQKLTPREIDVLQEVAAGRTSRETGKKLNISCRTIQKHRENICKKLGLTGYRSLFNWCVEHMDGVDEI